MISMLKMTYDTTGDQSLGSRDTFDNIELFDYYASMITHVTAKYSLSTASSENWSVAKESPMHPCSLLLIYYRICSGDTSSLPPNFASL